MKHTESTSNIPEKQYLKGKIGESLNLVLTGENNVPDPGSGMVQMDSYDSTYLKVDTCAWYPAGEHDPKAATFWVSFTPLRVGTTEVKLLIQPQAINPLNLPVTFVVTIEAA
jgi:hypothetical protein